jgi:prepilin-type N-terminal cleavage/methylation domain-containing protein
MRNTKGFTLTELLIVVAIVAILAAVLIPNILNARSRALQAAAQSYARDILIALESVQSAYTPVDWWQTALANTITVVSNKELQTVNSGWKDSAGEDVRPSPEVKFEDFLKKPGQAGIEAAIVGKKRVGTDDVVVICVSQKVGSKYNIYSLYLNTNQFQTKLNQGAAVTDIGNCP